MAIKDRFNSLDAATQHDIFTAINNQSFKSLLLSEINERQSFISSMITPEEVSYEELVKFQNTYNRNKLVMDTYREILQLEQVFKSQLEQQPQDEES